MRKFDRVDTRNAGFTYPRTAPPRRFLVHKARPAMLNCLRRQRLALAAVFAWLPLVANGQPAPAASGSSVPAAAVSDAATTNAALKTAPAAGVGAVAVDPLVAEVLALKLERPEEISRGVNVLLNLGQPALAKQLLERLTGADLDTAALADLGRRLGATTFLRWAHVPELAPQAEAFARRVWEAGQTTARDPARLATSIDELGDPQRAPLATAALVGAGPAGAVALIEVLADPRQSPRHEFVADTLLAMPGEAVPPLIAALETDDAQGFARFASVLARLGDQRAAIDLLRFTLADDATRRAAAERALQALQGYVPGAARALAMLAAQGRAALAEGERLAATESVVARWTWNARQLRPEPRDLPAPSAQAQAALAPLQVARQHLPDDTELAYDYYRALVTTSGPHPSEAVQRALARESDTWCEELLDRALADHRRELAVEVLAHLAERGDAGWLAHRAPRLAGVTQALAHADAEIRWAALGTIARWKPQTTFPGTSLVTQATSWFVQATGLPRAVVADPRAHEAQRLAGLLTSVGYQAEIATDGRSLFQLAADMPDCEMILLSPALNCPTAAETLAMLRHDARTALVPVALVAEAAQFPGAEKLAASQAAVAALYRPHDEAGVRYLLDRLGAITSRRPASAEARLARAQTALGWMAEWSAGRSPFDLAPAVVAAGRAAFDPRLGAGAMLVLADQPSAAAQRRLVDLASHVGRPVELRRSAAAAFVTSVDRHGVLLTAAEVLDQYTRYNGSALEDGQTQAVLASILDALESSPEPAAPR